MFYDDEFSLLVIAFRLHTSVRMNADITVQACFDGDRLKFGRIGIQTPVNGIETPALSSAPFVEYKNLVRCQYTSHFE